MMKKGKEVFSRQREQNVLQELKGRMTGVGGARTNRTEFVGLPVWNLVSILILNLL